MKPSVPNYEDPMPVDLVYRQDKCISLDDFNLDGLDYVDIECTEEACHGGKISCLKACQALNTTIGFQYQLAFITDYGARAEGAKDFGIYDHFCTCATYASLPPILKGFRIIQPQTLSK